MASIFNFIQSIFFLATLLCSTLITDKKALSYSEKQKFKDRHLYSCDETKQTSGYIKVNDNYMFFWYFESQATPKNDPLTLWLNGGPGTSSIAGLMLGIGPCYINKHGNETKRNPYSWNRNSNLLIFDQPIGTGFSYGSSRVSDTVTASKDIVTALRGFFIKFPQLLSNELHIASESYGGHFAPHVALEILNFNKEREATGLKFNLASVIVGNGLFDPIIQYATYAEYACSKLDVNPILIQTCYTLLTLQEEIDSLLNSCKKTKKNCLEAYKAINVKLFLNQTKIGLNYLDVREHSVNINEYEKSIEYYFNLPHVQQSLKVKPTIFSNHNETVTSDFYLNNDVMLSVLDVLGQLLDNNIDLLIFVGETDMLCNYLGILKVAESIPWSNQQRFLRQPFHSIVSKNKTLWYARVQGPLSLVQIPNAGHFVRFNKPRRLQKLISRWLHHRSISRLKSRPQPKWLA